MSSKLDELAERSAQKNGGTSANYIAANQALRDDLLNFLESKFAFLNTEINSIRGELKKCQNDLLLSRNNEEKLLKQVSSMKECFHKCKCARKSSEDIYLIGSSLLREIRDDNIENGQVTCLRGGCIKDAKEKIENFQKRTNKRINKS